MIHKFLKLFWQSITIKHFDFRGRAARAEFWSFVLIYYLIQTAFNLLNFSLLLNIHLPYFSNTIWLIFLIAFAAVGVRRFHDVGRKGLDFLLRAFVPPVLLMGTFFTPIGMAILYIPYLFTAFAILWGLIAIRLIFILSLPSQSHPNEYGEIPTLQ